MPADYCQEAPARQRTGHTRQDCVPVHPVETGSRYDKAVPGLVGEVLGPLAGPPDIWSITSIPRRPDPDHGSRGVHRVNPVREVRQRPRQFSCTAPNVKHDPRLVLHQANEHLENLSRVRRVVDVGVDHTPVFEVFGVLGPQVPGLRCSQCPRPSSARETRTTSRSRNPWCRSHVAMGQ